MKGALPVVGIVILILFLWLVGQRMPADITGVPTNTISYPATETSLTNNCNWDGRIGFALAVNNMPDNKKISSATVQSTIISVSNPVNNMWIGSTGTATAEIVMPSQTSYPNTVWLGGFGNAGGIALRKDTSIDGICRIDYSILYVSISGTPSPVPSPTAAIATAGRIPLISDLADFIRSLIAMVTGQFA